MLFYELRPATNWGLWPLASRFSRPESGYRTVRKAITAGRVSTTRVIYRSLKGSFRRIKGNDFSIYHFKGKGHAFNNHNNYLLPFALPIEEDP